MTARPSYQRILLKLSGEALGGSQGFGVDPARAQEIAQEIADVRNAVAVRERVRN